MSNTLYRDVVERLLASPQLEKKLTAEQLERLRKLLGREEPPSSRELRTVFRGDRR